MPLDKLALRVFQSYIGAAIDEAAYELIHGAYSTSAAEAQDFSIGLATPEGETFVYPGDKGTSWSAAKNIEAALCLIPDYQDGDICMTNDPYSGFLATHTPDIYLWKPIFHQGDLVCFVWSHFHHTDVGGIVLSSISRHSTEIFQEGLRIPAMKLYKAGVLNTDIMDIIKTNVRIPEQSIGDFKAHLVAVNSAERGVHEIIAKLGLYTFKQGMLDLLAYSEELTKAIIAQIPDGEYFFVDFLDNDAASDMPLRIACNMKIQANQMYLDFTGSDPQVPSSLNIPTGGHGNQGLLLVSLMHYFKTANPDLPLNAAISRPIHCILPVGTVMNCVLPAAVGSRSPTCMRVFDVIMGCLSQALPEKIPAAAGANVAVMVMSYTDPKTGKHYATTLEPILGGGGATPFHDGVAANGGFASAFLSRPVESVEAQAPVHVHCFNLVSDSGGPGKYRGGLASLFEFQVVEPGCSVTIRNRDRVKFRPWGIQGGKAGLPSSFILNRGAPNERDLGDADVVFLERGDIASIITPGGGGYGNPLERDAEAVLQDVRCGFVSKLGAEQDYGVIIEGKSINLNETKKLRARIKRQKEAAPFDFGPERKEYDAAWPKAVYNSLTNLLMGLPITERYPAKKEIYKELKGHVVTTEDVKSAWNHLSLKGVE